MSLFGIGMSFAYYLPAIPIIYWISGSLTWVVSVFEALVAAPFWAIGHILYGTSGGNRGAVSTSAVSGYYILANLFLRPALMVVGMVMSIYLMRIAGAIINATYVRYVLEGMVENHIHGPLTVIAFLALLVIIVLSSAHHIFSLITTLPDMVMRWLDKAMPTANDRQVVEGAATKFAVTAAGTSGIIASTTKKLTGGNK